MKKGRRLIALPLLMLPMCMGATAETLTFDYYSDYYYPFHSSESVRATIKLGYRFTGNSSRTVYETFSYFSKGERVYYEEGSNGRHTLFYRKKYAPTFNVDVACLTDGVKAYDMLFEIRDASTDAVLGSANLYVKRQRRETVAIEDYLDEPLEYDYSTFSLSASEIDLYAESETYDFSLMKPYFGSETYYVLDLSNQTIIYNYSLPYRVGLTYLIFEDDENIFPYIFYMNGDGRKRILLTMTQQGNQLKFSINPTFYYYSYELHQISDAPLTGFESVTDFILPLGKKNNMEGKEFELVIEKAGGNRTKFTYHMTYTSDKNLFGGCSNSEYCVRGGLANG